MLLAECAFQHFGLNFDYFCFQDEEPVFAPEFSKMEFGSAFVTPQSQRNLSKETAIHIV